MKQSAEVNKVLGGRLNDIIRLHRKKRTAILIADRRIAKIFTKNGDSLNLIATLKPEPMDFSKGLSNHNLGRIVSSCSRFIHHKLEPRKTPGEEEASLFARQVSEWLDETVRDNTLDRLILVAAPAMLGNLRKSMSKQVQNLVNAEAARDLTKMNDKKLYKELKKIVQM